MARQPKSATNLQVFLGSKPQPDVFMQNAGLGCCDVTPFNYDKLGERVRFDNALAHLNPTGANDKWEFRYGREQETKDIVAHINEHGVGASISVLVIPTYAFVKAVGIHVYGSEPGLTFNLTTRNGLDLTSGTAIEVSAKGTGAECEIERVKTDTTAAAAGQLIGTLAADELFTDTFILLDETTMGAFSLEADEIQLTVASMPASGKVNGDFGIKIAVNYGIVNRAER